MIKKLYTQNRARYSAAGFTLIELLVVMAIIGLLSSVILASLGSVRLRARDAAIKQIVGQMRAIRLHSSPRALQVHTISVAATPNDS